MQQLLLAFRSEHVIFYTSVNYLQESSAPLTFSLPRRSSRVKEISKNWFFGERMRCKDWLQVETKWRERRSVRERADLMPVMFPGNLVNMSSSIRKNRMESTACSGKDQPELKHYYPRSIIALWEVSKILCSLVFSRESSWRQFKWSWQHIAGQRGGFATRTSTLQGKLQSMKISMKSTVFLSHPIAARFSGGQGVQKPSNNCDLSLRAGGTTAFDHKCLFSGWKGIL